MKKFCIDCKHRAVNSVVVCTAPQAHNFRALVSGRWPEATEMRRDINLRCGEEARWFEPIPPAPPQLPWWRRLLQRILK